LSGQPSPPASPGARPPKPAIRTGPAATPLSQAALAWVAFTSGNLDAAVYNANRALDLAVTVKSSRCIHAITDLRTRIQPFYTVALARDFEERARLTLAASRQT
jgi:hypothetical protein